MKTYCISNLRRYLNSIISGLKNKTFITKFYPNLMKFFIFIVLYRAYIYTKYGFKIKALRKNLYIKF
jgi:hypothetical protein